MLGQLDKFKLQATICVPTALETNPMSSTHRWEVLIGQGSVQKPKSNLKKKGIQFIELGICKVLGRVAREGSIRGFQE